LRQGVYLERPQALVLFEALRKNGAFTEEIPEVLQINRRARAEVHPMSDKQWDQDKVTVELNYWECECIILGLIQMANTVPRIETFSTMAQLQTAEILLAQRINAAALSIRMKFEAQVSKP